MNFPGWRFHPLMGDRKGVYSVTVTGNWRITVPMALRIGKLCGNGGGIWMRMQQSYDRKLAEREMAAELEAIPTLETTA